MAQTPKKPAAKRGAPKKPPEPKVHMAEHGRTAAVQAGTSDRDVAEALTGLDQVPTMGMELGRPPSAPPFDPHAERDSIISGMDDDEDLDEVPIISTMVFVGTDKGDGEYERRLREVIAYAEGKGLINLTATMSEIGFDLLDAIVDGNG